MTTKGRIFVLDDDELICTMLERSLKKEGYEIQAETTTEDVVNKIRDWQADLILLDIQVDEFKSGLDVLEELKKEDVPGQVVMLTADTATESVIAAMKLGAVDYLTKPFNRQEVNIVISNIIEKQRLKEEVDFLREAQSSQLEERMVGESPAMKQLKAKADKLAQAQVKTVLITGESGTGKEVMARYIHNQYFNTGEDPKYKPFIAVNCTALPEHLIESELFGHTKGAYTDAKTDKKGVFELADGGTILLDEIGEMDINLQSKLLRVIEDRNVRRLGGKVDIPIDVTVIVTTNTDLEAAIQAQKFRTDLFYRLNAFPIHMPPLRDRREDIPLLAEYYLALFAKQYMKKGMSGFSKEAEARLVAHDWRGNIRELRNMIERIVVLENAETIQPDHLPIVTVEKIFVERRKSTRFMLPPSGVSLEELEKDLIQQALDRASNNKTMAAKSLHVSYDVLRYKMKKYSIA